MRLTAILLLVGSLTVSAHGRAQERVTLHLKGVTLKTVLDRIQEQTGYNYIFSGSEVHVSRKFDVDVRGATIQEVLDQCLKDLPVTYEVTGRMIKITRKNDVTPAGDLLANGLDSGGELVVIVSTEDGSRLPGASVEIKGIEVGGVTNDEGIVDAKSVPVGQYVLDITYVGYQRVETQITVRAEKLALDFTMKRVSNNLDEVAIIAYGQTTQRLATGDVTMVSSRQLEDHSVSNPLAAMEGMVPGLFITQSTGMPGGSFSVQVRGQNSIQNGNNPFYVIDGVPYSPTMLQNKNPAGGGNPLNFLSVGDIESISVLKDADATAIYGSRAANGAILITTKKGKVGRTRVDINAYTGVGHAPMNVKWLNTPQYLEMRHEAFQNDGEVPGMITDPDLLVWDTSRYTDWQKTLIGGAAKYNDLQASVSGGSLNTQVLFGVGYHGESSVFPDAGTDGKVSAHLNVNTASNDQRFKSTVTVSYVYDRSNMPTTDLTFFIPGTAPDAPNPFNSDGSLNWANNTWVIGSSNPLSYTKQLYLAQTSNLISNAVLSYHLLKGLDIRSSFGYTDMQVGEIDTHPAAAQNPAYFVPTASASFTNNNIHSWIIEPQFKYVLPVGRSKFDVLAGSTLNQTFSNGQILNATGFSNDALVMDPQAATTLTIGLQTDDVYKYNALFGRAGYDYSDKYLLNVNLRRDGSSRFGPDMQFHNFESVGAAWVFSNEMLMKDLLPVLSFGKITASYGTTGNDQIGDYTFYDLYSPSVYPYQGVVGLNSKRLDNPYLAWEQTNKFEVGINLGFFKDKAILSGDFYRNRSSNELLATPVSTVTGFSTISLNLPAVVQNEGYEVSVSANNIRSKHFSWTSSFNLTVPSNKLVAFPNLSSSAFKNLYVVGQSVSVIRAFHMTGVDSATGVYKFATKGDPFNPSFPTDWTVNINLQPHYYGGFRNSFTYEGFQLDVLLQFVKQLGQNDLFQQDVPAGVAGFNVSRRMLSRWQIPGQSASYEKFTQDFGSAAANAYNYINQSDYNYTDASFIRLKNVSLSYQFPARWMYGAHFTSVRVYVRGENLWTLTHYKGMDPENQGVTSLPPLRVVTAGLNIGL